MVGFFAVQSKAHILVIYLPYILKGEEGGWKKAWLNRSL